MIYERRLLFKLQVTKVKSSCFIVIILSMGSVYKCELSHANVTF